MNPDAEFIWDRPTDATSTGLGRFLPVRVQAGVL
jgi:hypothetical protein